MNEKVERTREYCSSTVEVSAVADLYSDIAPRFNSFYRKSVHRDH